jgi:hypothetical protein
MACVVASPLAFDRVLARRVLRAQSSRRHVSPSPGESASHTLWVGFVSFHPTHPDERASLRAVDNSRAVMLSLGCTRQAQGERIEQRLLRGSERDLNLNGDARRRKAEDVTRRVVSGTAGTPVSMCVKSNSPSRPPGPNSVISPLAKNVCGPASPGSIVQLSISIDSYPAPAKPGPPPIVWKQPVSWASPHVVPARRTRPSPRSRLYHRRRAFGCCS